MVFYTRRTLQDLAACMHSLPAYILHMRAEGENGRAFATYPPPHVTAAGVDSAGPIGHTRKGIDFCPRTGYDWAYLSV